MNSLQEPVVFGYIFFIRLIFDYLDFRCRGTTGNERYGALFDEEESDEFVSISQNGITAGAWYGYGAAAVF